MLSSLQHLHHPDITAFFRLIGLYNPPQQQQQQQQSSSSSSSSLIFSASEVDVRSIINGFVKKMEDVDTIPANSFLLHLVDHLKDVGMRVGVINSNS